MLLDDKPLPSPPPDPPAYTLSTASLSSTASLEDGRLLLDLRLAKGLPDLPKWWANDAVEEHLETAPASSEGLKGKVPKLKVLILIVGSRGDVQPFVVLARALVQHGHRVRLATHGTFRQFVHDAGRGEVEFFDIGGDPKELLAWMVKNPGLMPGFESLTNGDVARKTRVISEILEGCHRATFENDASSSRPFTPDILLSNPPTFAHVHLAEAMGLPLHMTFCMPWSPTIEFSHPLVQVRSSNAKKGLTNYLSFGFAEMITWQGLSGVTNTFRKRTLGLEPLSSRSGPSVLDRLKVPWTYCWSRSLIPKPLDWKNTIDVSGFYFLETDSNYSPPPEMQAFLDAGEPPIYIGFGSVPVQDPSKLSTIIFSAVERAGVRAVVSVGWGGLGGVEVDRQRIFLLGETPHDWLFPRVRAVVHHGGAGTTAVGLLNGKATAVVPWFGDQFWWGERVSSSGAGPTPIPGKRLDVESLTEALRFLCRPEAAEAAGILGARMRRENGVADGLDSIYRHLPLKNMRCDLDPSLVAVWWSSRLCLRLSTLAAQTLADARKLEMGELELHRPKEYDTRKQASDPITGGSAAVLTTIADYTRGIGQIFINPPKGIINTTTAIPKGMLNIIIGVYEGFSNLPKSYGSSTRTVDHRSVRNFSTGLEEGAKNFAGGIWDGCVGLVMEPIQGGKKNGVVGAVQGVGQSWLNLIMRPAAGALALVALPAHGALKSLQRTSKQAPSSGIRSIRLAEGQEAFATATSETKRDLLQRFKVVDRQTGARRKAYRGQAWRFLGTKSQKGKEKGLGVSGRGDRRLTLLPGTEADEVVEWMMPPSYDDVHEGESGWPIGLKEEDDVGRMGERV